MKVLLALLAALAATSVAQTCCEVAEFSACLVAGSTPQECETAPCSGYVAVPCSQSSVECVTIPGFAPVGSSASCEFDAVQNLQPTWAVEAVRESSWNWDGATGPEFWGLTPAYAVCATGTEQSPINIIPGSADVVAVADDSPVLGDIASHSSAAYVTAQSKGAPKYDCASPGTCGSVTWSGATYNVLQFHMHAMSENAINGRSYPIEFHFVHQNPENGALLVVGVLVEMSAGAFNSALADVLSASTVESSGVSVNFDPSALYDGAAGFYNWAGSLTTPPCSEGVTWILSKTVATISPEQWMPYWTHIGGYPGNARDWQPLNGRIISSF
eukprot:CAMPEP_0185856426 /NCGR_PEP_ID=MMETSP1354-20130828/28986_1 /TAXON_ID=708628 /ORGANISM="Erythrolobus madagascarensis, Strain CCMP3276" /LENGTH=328 /DNA_ID=CAMNT_0028558673 /DNA_START=81 /DNA_END=1067 /DNA_ORIENTATION=+